MIKVDSEDNFCIAFIKPNKFSMLCCAYTYISPNDRTNYKPTLEKINKYNNITIVVYGDFNRKLGNRFPDFTRLTLDWTYQKDGNQNIRTVTDFFMYKNNANKCLRANLEENSNRTTFASSDHRLMALRVDIPIQTERKKYKIPTKLTRGKYIDNILKNTNDPKKFFGIIDSEQTTKTVTFKVPIVPYRFVEEIRLCMETRDIKSFLKKIKKQWKIQLEGCLTTGMIGKNSLTS